MNFERDLKITIKNGVLYFLNFKTMLFLWGIMHA